MGRMARPPRGMPHPQRMSLPPEMMGPDGHPGMRPRMPHQFMSPTHSGMGDMPQTSMNMTPSPHGMPPSPHGMQTSPHGMQTSPHGMQTSPLGMQQTSPHGIQRPPMHHPIMQVVPSSHPQTSGPASGGGPLASLANFHPPGHLGINTTLGSPMPGGHPQRPPHMFPQMMPGGDPRMAARLRMMAASEVGPQGPGPMGQHFRMMIRPGSQPSPHQQSPQMTSPQMSPHHHQMSPQMSPSIPGQPMARHLDAIPDDKSFIGQTLVNPDPANIGAKSKLQRPGFGPGVGSEGFMGGHPPLQQQMSSESLASGLPSPLSDTGIQALVKLEPSEDSADSSVTRDDLDIDKAKNNELLKQLLGTNGRQQPTPDSEDSLPSLTPEQQRQLEMIDSMPLCKETEVPTTDWENKTPEEKEKILDMRRQEYEQKRQQIEASRKIKRKNVTSPGAPQPPGKKKRKPKAALAPVVPPGMPVATSEVGVAELPKKKSKKGKLKENQLKELEAQAQAETLLQQLHNMPPIPLQEPIIANHMSILPIKGATHITGVSSLKGRYCSAYLENIEDLYGSLLFPQPPPGLRAKTPSADLQKQLATQAKLRMLQGMGR